MRARAFFVRQDRPAFVCPTLVFGKLTHLACRFLKLIITCRITRGQPFEHRHNLIEPLCELVESLRELTGQIPSPLPQ